MTEARRLHLWLWSGALKPGASVGTMNPRTRPSSFAQTIAIWETLPFVIHIFRPLRTYSSPSFRAVVSMPPGLEPKSGSVSPKLPIISPEASLGRYSRFCSSLPYSLIGHITREPWTEQKLRRPESPRSSSWQIRP